MGWKNIVLSSVTSAFPDSSTFSPPDLTFLSLPEVLAIAFQITDSGEVLVCAF